MKCYESNICIEPTPGKFNSEDIHVHSFRSGFNFSKEKKTVP
jgi:hypothetical protein